MILRDPLIPSSQVLGRCSLSEARLPTTPPPLLALRGMSGGYTAMTHQPFWDDIVVRDVLEDCFIQLLDTHSSQTIVLLYPLPLLPPHTPAHAPPLLPTPPHHPTAQRIYDSLFFFMKSVHGHSVTTTCPTPTHPSLTNTHQAFRDDVVVWDVLEDGFIQLLGPLRLAYCFIVQPLCVAVHVLVDG